MPTPTGNPVHDANVASAESMRQAAVSAAGANQPAVNAASAAYYKAVQASAHANGLPGVEAACNAALAAIGAIGL